MNNVIKIITLSLLIFLASCIRDNRPTSGDLPTTPVNLTDFNTQHDDYNSTAPTLGELIPFCFSTNRHSIGGQFDIIYKPMNVNFDRSSEVLKVTDKYDNWSSRRDDYEILRWAISNIKTTGNEFGPNLIADWNVNELEFTMLYSSDITGNSDIYFVSNLTDSLFSEPKEVQFLNSDSEDLYPTFNSEKSKIYFCSDRGGNKFDFYSTNVDPELDLESMLSEESSSEIIMESVLSSNSNDKCPTILGDKMVFTSDREGGFGGYDLYYSDFINGEWGAPINFGAEINSEADEFRPILINEGVSSSQTMMVFSSDRDGGMGGFDLYFVGVDSE